MMTAVVLVAAAACGGDDTADQPDDAGAGGAEGDGTTDDAPTEGSSDEVQEVLDGLDFGDGAARVTIGDTSYEFALGGTSSVGSVTYLGVCQQLFGMLGGSGYDAGGRDITIDFEILPDDWESYDDDRFEFSSNRLEIEDQETGVAWAADDSLAELYPETAGSSQIDDWVSDGSRASGTATFIPLEPWSAPVEGASPVTGTFELGCADD